MKISMHAAMWWMWHFQIYVWPPSKKWTPICTLIHSQENHKKKLVQFFHSSRRINICVTCLDRTAHKLEFITINIIFTQRKIQLHTWHAYLVRNSYLLESIFREYNHTKWSSKDTNITWNLKRQLLDGQQRKMKLGINIIPRKRRLFKHQFLLL